MDQKDRTSFNPGMALIVCGVLTYIVVDSGLIKGVSLSFLKQPQAESPQNRDESLEVYANKIQAELGTVESAVVDQKVQLRKLQKEISTYENNIARQKQNLKELDENIRNLTQLKKSTSLVITAQNKRSRSPASFESIAASVDRDSTYPTTIESIAYGTGDFMRLKTNLRFDSEKTIYLTSRGLRQVRVFVEGMQSLGYKNITLAYQLSSDTETLERLQVLRSHLLQTYGEEITVSTSPLKEADLILVDGLELWAAKAGS